MDKYSWSDPPSSTAFPVARAGYLFIIASAFATIVFALLGLTALSLLGIVVTVCVTLFFRDPDRVIPIQSGLVVSPADGKVIDARIVERNPYYEGSALKIVSSCRFLMCTSTAYRVKARLQKSNITRENFLLQIWIRPPKTTSTMQSSLRLRIIK